MRIFFILSCFCAILFANDNNASFTFKAKGELAEELKTLLQKHAKNGEIEIVEDKNVSQIATPQEIKQNEKPIVQELKKEKQERSVIDVLLGNNEIIDGDIKKGQFFYRNASCAHCHGENADIANGSKKAPIKLSKNEIYNALYQYKRDKDYGGSSKLTMQRKVSNITDLELKAIASYIDSLKPKQKIKTNTEKKVTKSYLK